MSLRHKRGFTLLELIIVLALTALLLSISAPVMYSVLPGLEMRKSVRELTAVMRYARSAAMTSGEDMVVTIYLNERFFTVTNKDKKYSLPDQNDADINIETVESESPSEDVAGFRFFNDGSSTGGRITLTRKGVEYDIDIDWLNGRIQQTETDIE